jgi:hypothetical protein
MMLTKLLGFFLIMLAYIVTIGAGCCVSNTEGVIGSTVRAFDRLDLTMIPFLFVSILLLFIGTSILGVRKCTPFFDMMPHSYMKTVRLEPFRTNNDSLNKVLQTTVPL